jgi:SAM-dependent methyltransferase
MTGESPEWWKTYFDADFHRLYRPLLPPEETEEAVQAVLELTGLSAGMRVLDLACGWGRHAVELAAAGLQVAALDRALPLLRLGSAGPGGDRVAWVCGDLREIPLAPSFDAVVCLFSSLGYFGSDAEDLRVLEEVRRLLATEGVFVLETVHRDGVVRDYVERDWWEGEDGETVFVDREFDVIQGVTREWLRWTRPDGATGEKFHSARIRSASEWKDLLLRAELEPIAWYGGWDGGPFDHTSERLIVVATAGP